MERFTTTNLCLAILLLAGNFVSFSLRAQHPSEVSDQISKAMPSLIPKSPNVAAFDRYGDYQVNLFSGIPSISIPIHEARSGSLAVPITLNYHAAGVKYTDQASWVGLGWSINAGGVVSRSIQGMIDERQGFFTNPIDWNVQSNPNCSDYDYLKNSTDYKIDREPDLYSYSFPGGSGKFYRQQNGLDPYVFPYRPVKIDFVTFDKIEITDENGVLYRYGQNAAGASARELTISQVGSSYTDAVTAWHLMEIKAPNSDDYISMTYQSAGQVYTTDVNHNITVVSDCETDSNQALPCPPLDLMLTEQNTYSSIPSMGIDEMFFEGGKVKFIQGGLRNDITSANSLESIEIYSLKNGLYTKIKSYHFVYGYFKNSNSTQDLRLKLTEFQLRDGAGNLVNKHSFQYHTNTFSWDWPTNSYRRDYWGFYNGKPNSNLIPVTTIQYQPNSLVTPGPLTFGGADRSTDATYLTEGTLKEIHYPTGGHTVFEFEPHQYDDNGTPALVGGLRIKKITSYDSPATPAKIKEYKYGAGESGRGIQNFDLRTAYFNTSQVIRTAGTEQPPPYRQYTSTMYFSNSVLGQGFDDSPVIYPIVTEYDGTSSVNNGKTVFEFDNNIASGDPIQTVMYSTKMFRNYKAWARGKLTKKVVYNSSGAPVSETNISYTLLKNETNYISQGIVHHIIANMEEFKYYYIPCAHSNGLPFDGMTYAALNFQQSTGVYKESGTTEILYTNGLPTLTKTTSKTYNADYLQLISQEESGSGTPEVRATKFRYPFDIVNMGTTYTGTPKAFKDLLLKNIYSIPFEKYTIVQKSDGSDQKVISGQVTTFKSNPANSAQIVTDKIYILEINSAISPASHYVLGSLSGTSTFNKDSRYQERINFSAYDVAGNIREVIKTSDNPISYLWDYSNTQPIAQIVNAPIGGVAYTSFESDGKGNWVFSGATSADSNSPVGAKGYLLSDGNITKSGLSSGTTYIVSYWSNNGAKTVSGSTSATSMGSKNGYTLYEHKVTGVTSVTISGSGQIDELRLHPVNAQMTSYDYEPGIGVVTEIDANNISTNYVYDSLGRLKLIKDHKNNILKTYTYNYKN